LGSKIADWFSLGRKAFRKNSLRLIGICYMLTMTYLGTLLVIQGVLNFAFKDAAPQIEQVPLDNGFVYIAKNKGVIDGEGNVIVPSGLEKMGVRGNTIYGHYDDAMVDTLYFVCTYGEDCSESLRYSEKEYRETLKVKRLPALSFPSFEYPAGLVTKEWLKRKLTFQDAPPTPFFKDPNSGKMAREGLSFMWAIAAGIVKYTNYGVFVLLTLVVLAGGLGIHVYKVLRAKIKTEKPTNPMFFIGKKMLSYSLRFYIYFMSFMMTIIYFLTAL